MTTTTLHVWESGFRFEGPEGTVTGGALTRSGAEVRGRAAIERRGLTVGKVVSR